MSLMLVMKSRKIEKSACVPHHVVLYKRTGIHPYREAEDRTEIVYVTWLESADDRKPHGLNGERCWGHYNDTPTEGLKDFLERCTEHHVEPELWSR